MLLSLYLCMHVLTKLLANQGSPRKICIRLFVDRNIAFVLISIPLVLLDTKTIFLILLFYFILHSV